MLDPLHTNPDCLVDAGRGMGMCGHRQAAAVRLGDQQPQVGKGELGRTQVGAWGVHPAAGHHLHNVDAALYALGDSSDDLLGGGDLTAEEAMIAGLWTMDALRAWAAHGRWSAAEWFTTVGGAALAGALALPLLSAVMRPSLRYDDMA